MILYKYITTDTMIVVFSIKYIYELLLSLLPSVILAVDSVPAPVPCVLIEELVARLGRMTRLFSSKRCSSDLQRLLRVEKIDESHLHR